ncbi:MAG: DUF2088 domain-containing protein [Candidatus Velthaea sp.]|jgi:hypothetical protein
MSNGKPAMIEAFLVRQQLDATRVEDVAAAVAQAFGQARARERIAPGASIAITAGSRGIDKIVEVLAAVVSEVRRIGGIPFVTTAMGSHGGATDVGQREVLTGYGITEEAVGCEIRSSMDVVSLGTAVNGDEVFCDRNAATAGGIVVVGRVKPHSILTGALGSGLLKMTAIGLGNQRGADAIHVGGVQQHLVPCARHVLAHAPIAFGIALVENPRDELALVRGVVPADFEAADRELLDYVRARSPALPFDPLDVLVVDFIGKDISGAGMDPNVIGMWRRNGGAPDRQIGRIVALDLTPQSHGNATGVGMADVITEQLRAKIDFKAMYTNALTSNFLWGAKVPLTVGSAREAIELACRPFAPDRLRCVRLRDTAHLEYLLVSRALLDAAGADGTLERVEGGAVALDAGTEVWSARV